MILTAPKRKDKRKIYMCFAFLFIVLFIVFAVINNKDNYMQTDNSITQSISSDWRLILVNQDNEIPDNYKIELTKLSNGESVDTRIYNSLQEMFDTARNNGIYPVVVAGFRTEKQQKNLMDQKIEEYSAQGYSTAKAKKTAKEWVAVPGTSEHQLGIAVDINADGINSMGNEVYEWLYENAHIYGFILRYPSDKTEITGISYEPWHYRYVGVEIATQIRQQEICLEEYLNKNTIKK